MAFNSGHCSFDGVFRGEVKLERCCLMSPFADVGCDCFTGFMVSAADDDVVVVLCGEYLGCGPSDALVGAGYQDKRMRHINCTRPRSERLR